MSEAATDPNPRARRTREALLAAGIALLSERSIDVVAIDEIVARAGVGKGSFFNHFADKAGFAAAVATGIRLELESWVSAANRAEPDAVLRLAGGLVTAAAYGLANPARARVLLRATSGVPLAAHPLNAGLRADLAAAGRDGRIAAPPGPSTVLYWLACCQAVMGELLAGPAGEDEAVAQLGALLALGLRGLGASPESIAEATEPARLRRQLAAIPPPAPAPAPPAARAPAGPEARRSSRRRGRSPRPT